MSRPGSEISYDYLHLSDKVSKIIGSNGTKEEVMFSDHVIKINRKGERQKRVLVITNKALYNIKDTIAAMDEFRARAARKLSRTPIQIVLDP